MTVDKAVEWSIKPKKQASRSLQVIQDHLCLVSTRHDQEAMTVAIPFAAKTHEGWRYLDAEDHDTP